jgi:peptidyl-prolyl cis-trans isomerase SurA
MTIRPLLAFALGLVLLAAPAVAATVIKVVVNGQPITSYDIAQRVAMQRVSGQTANSATATEELINEAIQYSEATRRGVTIPEAQVDAAYASIAQQVQLAVPAFTQALGQAGINSESLRRRLRAQLAWQVLMQARMQMASVRRDDITAALSARGDSANTMKEYTLQQIIFVVPSGASANVIAQRRREAESFRQRFAGCDGALAQARALRGVVVQNVGRRDTTQLAGPQGEEIQRTRPGRTTAPQATAQGVELLAVCNVREITSSAAARAEVENQLLIEQGETLGKEYLDELRARAIIERR